MTASKLKRQTAKRRVWICGKVLDWRLNRWIFEGVFSSRRAAEAACRDRRYFIGPAELNRSLPGRSRRWAGAVYPKLEDAA